MPARNRFDPSDALAGLKQGVLLGIAAVVLLLPPSGISSLARSAIHDTARASGASAMPQRAPRADFGLLSPSADARHVADWVASSNDNNRLPFAILDKRGARVFVFDAQARLIGSSLVLLGSAAGDDSVAGIGNRPLSAVRPHERTTAAGRFVSEPGHDETGDNVVWIDYDAALAMHRVKVIDPKERRFERIATDSIDDKRISNGCINVPVPYFGSVVEPALGHSRSVVYILPEIKPLRQVFQTAYDVAAQ
jgi:hypothetical protein